MSCANKFYPVILKKLKIWFTGKQKPFETTCKACQYLFINKHGDQETQNVYLVIDKLQNKYNNKKLNITRFVCEFKFFISISSYLYLD
jgi:hypothetical protein